MAKGNLIAFPFFTPSTYRLHTHNLAQITPSGYENGHKRNVIKVTVRIAEGRDVEGLDDLSGSDFRRGQIVGKRRGGQDTAVFSCVSRVFEDDQELRLCSANWTAQIQGGAFAPLRLCEKWASLIQAAVLAKAQRRKGR